MSALRPAAESCYRFEVPRSARPQSAGVVNAAVITLASGEGQLVVFEAAEGWEGSEGGKFDEAFAGVVHVLEDLTDSLPTAWVVRRSGGGLECLQRVGPATFAAIPVRPLRPEPAVGSATALEDYFGNCAHAALDALDSLSRRS